MTSRGVFCFRFFSEKNNNKMCKKKKKKVRISKIVSQFYTSVLFQVS